MRFYNLCNIKKCITIICFAFVSLTFIKAQNKFCAGIGLNAGILDFNKSKNENILGIPYGISLNGDYKINKKILLKSSINVKSQSVKTRNDLKDNLFKVSIPLIVSYSIASAKENRWNFSLESGISWDYNSKIESNIKDFYGTEISQIKSLYKTKYFNPNFNGRIGLNFSKKLNNKSFCNIFLHYIKSMHYSDRIYFETHELNLIENGVTS